MNPRDVFREKHILSEDQSAFAALSGDFNPVHVDPHRARRTQFGRPIVHGIHLVAWALDQYFEVAEGPRPASIKVQFVKPAFIGDVLRLALTEMADGGRKLEVTANGVVATTILLKFDRPSTASPNVTADPLCTTSAAPRELGIANIEGMRGRLPTQAAVVAASRAFPALARALGGDVVSALLATSRLVGMECPGMHSIFAGLSVDFVDPGCARADLAWEVARVDPRLRKVDLDVCGSGIAGRLQTFVRMPPTPQLGMDEIGGVVRRDEFAGHRALIVGGSRGLGEVTAKIIAAGGGMPVVTYAVGRDEAERLAEEIQQAGMRCRTMHYDVLHPAAAQLSELINVPGSFYYFATSSIFRRKSALYEPDLMREFLAYFVDGFYAICSELRARSPGKLAGFYPSTVALDQPLRELVEYCLAKNAGENLCAQISTFMPDVHIVVKRLPRILTDQTATLLPFPSKPPLETLLPIIREVQAMAGVAPE